MLKWQELLRERSLKRIQQAAGLVLSRLVQARNGERERGYKVRRDPPLLSDPFPLGILIFQSEESVVLAYSSSLTQIVICE